ncbi:MAG TPA: hypothetical protein VJM08_15820 [Anaerolineales bacterium]|nr:hypothetical protein [Anaerolineales bacterium]
MFEHRKEPLASPALFRQRMVRFGSFAAGIILCSLGIGILGYHYIVHLSWIDALLNASMLLGGMGPVDTTQLDTTPEKLFASFYALFSGMIFLIAIGVIATPIFHRFLHRFHLEMEDN